MKESVLDIGENIRTGAEARIFRGSLLDKDIIIKDRYPRKYRLKELDLTLRKQRTRSEAKLLAEARNCGIRTPYVLDLDMENCILALQHLPFPSLKETLGNNQLSRRQKKELIFKIGKLVGILHANYIVHGDLTTSNLVVNGNEIFFIDFGLAEKTHEIEKKGVDLHVFTEAFESTHSSILGFVKQFLQGYIRGNPTECEEVIGRMKEISGRGRYS